MIIAKPVTFMNQHCITINGRITMVIKHMFVIFAENNTIIKQAIGSTCLLLMAKARIWAHVGFLGEWFPERFFLPLPSTVNSNHVEKVATLSIGI